MHTRGQGLRGVTIKETTHVLQHHTSYSIVQHAVACQTAVEMDLVLWQFEDRPELVLVVDVAEAVWIEEVPALDTNDAIMGEVDRDGDDVEERGAC